MVNCYVKKLDVCYSVWDGEEDIESDDLIIFLIEVVLLNSEKVVMDLLKYGVLVNFLKVNNNILIILCYNLFFIVMGLE